MTRIRSSRSKQLSMRFRTIGQTPTATATADFSYKHFSFEKRFATSTKQRGWISRENLLRFSFCPCDLPGVSSVRSCTSAKCAEPIGLVSQSWNRFGYLSTESSARCASWLASTVTSRDPNSIPTFFRKSVGGVPPAKIQTKSLAIS